MTNKELADQLNVTVGLTGKDAVTVNVIRQWVDWDVLPKATARGRMVGTAPAWSRDNESQIRAVRLAELRKAGIRRKNAVIAQAYFEWEHPDFDLVRDAILSEFIKWRAPLNRRQTTFFGQKSFAEVGAWKQRAIKNQLGPLDQRFVGTLLEQTSEFYASFIDAARTGDADTRRMTSMLNEAINRYGPEIEQMFPKERIAAVAPLIAGLTGDPDEIVNSGEATIRNATPDQFEKARKFVRLIINMSEFPFAQIATMHLREKYRDIIELYSRLHPQISIGPWMIFIFVIALHVHIKFPELGRHFPDITKIFDSIYCYNS
ncbi:hypothetical protein [Sphingopyxis granuli]|uniref:hypothetical protein n=1 Tax=Sphingopyxis granuli TaxID=267128 RepID=UPI000ADFE809|nr:hypothetical protein [Sphingopyxis granuli]